MDRHRWSTRHEGKVGKYRLIGAVVLLLLLRGETDAVEMMSLLVGNWAKVINSTTLDLYTSRYYYYGCTWTYCS